MLLPFMTSSSSVTRAAWAEILKRKQFGDASLMPIKVGRPFGKVFDLRNMGGGGLDCFVPNCTTPGMGMKADDLIPDCVCMTCTDSVMIMIINVSVFTFLSVLQKVNHLTVGTLKRIPS